MRRFAAIDIGSNSVRLQIADAVRPEKGLPDLSTVMSDREVTRLGEGVFRKRGKIGRSTTNETCAVLERMARTCKALKIDEMRVVATSAVREAKNRLEFLNRADKILGCPVEVISGLEEAKLVHLGVHARWPQRPQTDNSLIVDVGGGSAQLIYGSREAVIDKLSRPLGALRLKEKFLAHDPPKKNELRKMNAWIDEKLSLVIDRFQADSVPGVLATSGAAAAVVCAVNGVRRDREQADRLVATHQQVQTLYERVCGMDLPGRLRIPGVGQRRAEVILPGIAVLMKILDAFGKPDLTYTAAGVRDGIIADLAMREAPRPAHEEHFHVFLSYNSKEKKAIRDIAKLLRDRGIVPWLDVEQLRPGQQLQTVLASQIEKIRSAALFVGPSGMSPFMRLEATALVRQFVERDCPVIPVILKETPAEPDIPGFLKDMMWVDFRMDDPDPLDALVWGIIGERPPAKRRRPA